MTDGACGKVSDRMFADLSSVELVAIVRKQFYLTYKHIPIDRHEQMSATNN